MGRVQFIYLLNFDLINESFFEFTFYFVKTRYGDKTPKSVSGRLFSVVWIMTGITVCSILTATLSSALMNVTVAIERYDVIRGKTVSNRVTNPEYS